MLRSLKDSFTRRNSSKGDSFLRKNSDTPNPATKPTRRPDRPNMNAFTTPTNEPPPAYTPAAAPFPGSIAPAMNPAPGALASNPASTTEDDRYAFLSTFDTVFLIDDSGSMAGRSWRETARALEMITPVCVEHDADGIDLYFLNAPDTPWYRNVSAASTIREIFSSVRPRGGTPTGQRLNAILRPYLARYAADPERTKPLNIIVITDGEPSDDVESPLIAAAKKLDRLEAPAWQVGVQFFQVGNEPGAREHLRQLDDDLGELAGDDDLRDMVDTVPYAEGMELNAEHILKVLLGSVVRRWDRKRSAEFQRTRRS
ncbi:hypothetical protein EJ06DRAFT_534188 [Trichodelitschia bisporula]|uniref:VWFA domain-containing protein n=1 Tax=Trichodelitschia bisporula TaxID=703511 RepID=A0A6G1HK76_9PEZI|nr:hypothetical protein EJ06DRAFT_534188 [Trichodelitschia bisporula]